MNIPATYTEAIEADAITFADAIIAKFKADFGFGLSMLNPDFGRDWMVRAFKSAAMSHPFQMGKIKQFAREGCEYSEQALRELAAEALARDGKPPAQLIDFAIDKLNPELRPRPSGRPKQISKPFQDFVLIFTVRSLINRFGLKPTGSSKRRASACGIAADRITKAGIGRPIGEKRAEEIWQDWLKREKIIMQNQLPFVLENPPN